MQLTDVKSAGSKGRQEQQDEFTLRRKHVTPNVLKWTLMHVLPYVLPVCRHNG